MYVHNLKNLKIQSEKFNLKIQSENSILKFNRPAQPSARPQTCACCTARAPPHSYTSQQTVSAFPPAPAPPGHSMPQPLLALPYHVASPLNKGAAGMQLVEAGLRATPHKPNQCIYRESSEQGGCGDAACGSWPASDPAPSITSTATSQIP